MALTVTSLTGAISASDQILVAASATGLVQGQFAQIDSEMVRLVAQNPNAPTNWTVARGQQGTLAVAHQTGAAVVTGPGEDWPVNQTPRTYSYGSAGAIVPAPGIHELNTGAASAMTLANPSKAQDGLTMLIVAKTAHAYTVTVPTAFQGADTGTVATFTAAIGNNFQITAQNGVWVVLSVAGVAIA